MGYLFKFCCLGRARCSVWDGKMFNNKGKLPLQVYPFHFCREDLQSELQQACFFFSQFRAHKVNGSMCRADSTELLAFNVSTLRRPMKGWFSSMTVLFLTRRTLLSSVIGEGLQSHINNLKC